jgi:hypothetical protein
MSNEWFDLAWINFTKAILHGQYVNDAGAEIQIEQVLTAAQRESVYDLNQRQADEMKALLRSMVPA